MGKQMTLDEAIEHLCDKLDEDDWCCEEYKEEHELLLGWLMELRFKRFADKYREMWGEELGGI